MTIEEQREVLQDKRISTLEERVKDLMDMHKEDQVRELEQARTIEHHKDLINSMADCIKSLEGIVTKLSRENDNLHYKIEQVDEALCKHICSPGEE